MRKKSRAFYAGVRARETAVNPLIEPVPPYPKGTEQRAEWLEGYNRMDRLEECELNPDDPGADIQPDEPADYE